MNITKVSVTLDATLDEGEYVYADTVRPMMNQAQHTVYTLVDEALEDAGKVAKHSAEPRFKAMQSTKRKCIVIVPNELSLKALPDDFTNGWGIPTGARLEHLQSLIRKRLPSDGVQVIDCADGDLTRIPPLPETQPNDAARSSLENDYEGGDE